MIRRLRSLTPMLVVAIVAACAPSTAALSSPASTTTAASTASPAAPAGTAVPTQTVAPSPASATPTATASAASAPPTVVVATPTLAASLAPTPQPTVLSTPSPVATPSPTPTLAATPSPAATASPAPPRPTVTLVHSADNYMHVQFDRAMRQSGKGAVNSLDVYKLDGRALPPGSTVICGSPSCDVVRIDMPENLIRGSAHVMLVTGVVDAAGSPLSPDPTSMPFRTDTTSG